jgi:hypothetical protein
MALRNRARPSASAVRASNPQTIPHSMVAVMTASQVSQNNGLRRIGSENPPGDHGARHIMKLKTKATRRQNSAVHRGI